jgi:hypothetical protein
MHTQTRTFQARKSGILPSRESVSFTAPKKRKTCVATNSPLFCGLGGDHTKAQAETYTSMWGKRGPKCQADSLFSPFFTRKKEKKGKSRFAHVKSPTLVTDARSLRLRVESYIPVPTKVLNHTHVWDRCTTRTCVLCVHNSNFLLSRTIFSSLLYTYTIPFTFPLFYTRTQRRLPQNTHSTYTSMHTRNPRRKHAVAKF